jgi:hypothetical protein
VSLFNKLLGKENEEQVPLFWQGTGTRWKGRAWTEKVGGLPGYIRTAETLFPLFKQGPSGIVTLPQ